jgi:hypothetical protein
VTKSAPERQAEGYLVWRSGTTKHLPFRSTDIDATRPPQLAASPSRYIRRSTASGKLPEQVLPNATPRPPHEAVIERRRRAIFWWAIRPAAAAFRYVHDAADDPAIVRPLDTANIRRQVRLDPFPLLIVQPKQVLAHDPNLTSQRESVSYCQRCRPECGWNLV